MSSLRDILKNHQISQLTVADALGINVNNIRRYDDLRKRSIEELEIISKSTGISMSELIGSEIDLTKTKPYEINSDKIDILQEQNADYIKINKEVMDLLKLQSETILSQQRTIEKLTKN